MEYGSGKPFSRLDIKPEKITFHLNSLPLPSTFIHRKCSPLCISKTYKMVLFIRNWNTNRIYKLFFFCFDNFWSKTKKCILFSFRINYCGCELCNTVSNVRILSQFKHSKDCNATVTLGNINVWSCILF